MNIMLTHSKPSKTKESIQMSSAKVVLKITPVSDLYKEYHQETVTINIDNNRPTPTSTLLNFSHDNSKKIPKHIGQSNSCKVNYPWANKSLTMLCNVSKMTYGAHDIANTNSEEIKAHLIKIIVQEHNKLGEGEISKKALDFCVRILDPKYKPGGIKKSKTVEKGFYPPYFSIVMINMLELAKDYHNANITKKDPITILYIKDIISKAKEEKIMPSGMIPTMARFIIPKSQ